MNSTNRHQQPRLALAGVLAAALLIATGCGVNNAESELHLGSVSIGQQLMDLQAAHKAGALSADELSAARSALLGALEFAECNGGAGGNGGDREVSVRIDSGSGGDDDGGSHRKSRASEEDDDDGGWLF